MVFKHTLEKYQNVKKRKKVFLLILLYNSEIRFLREKTDYRSYISKKIYYFFFKNL